MIVLKKILHALYKKPLTDFDYCAFSKMRDLCRVLSKSCKANCVQFVDSALSSNVKDFWRYDNGLRRKSSNPGEM